MIDYIHQILIYNQERASSYLLYTFIKSVMVLGFFKCSQGTWLDWLVYYW